MRSSVFVFVSNHRINVILFSCSMFLGPIIGGWLSDTIGFEWAAAVIGFTGFFAVSFLSSLSAANVA